MEKVLGNFLLFCNLEDFFKILKSLEKSCDVVALVSINTGKIKYFNAGSAANF